jgi:hypothetical protein
LCVAFSVITLDSVDTHGGPSARLRTATRFNGSR